MRDLMGTGSIGALRFLPEMAVPSAFKFCFNSIRFFPWVPGDLQDIGLAAYLAIFDVVLPAACRRIYAGFVPLPAACTLKARIAGQMGHEKFSGVQNCSGLPGLQSIGTGRGSLWIAASKRFVVASFRRMISKLVR